MALRRFVQLFGEEADEAGGDTAASAPLDLDRVLDSPLSTYSRYRLTLTLVLARVDRPPYCTYGLRVPASACAMRTGGAGPLAPGPHLPASGVPYAPRTVSPQVLAGWWLVSTDVYADIWTADQPNMTMCVCESDHGTQGGAAVLFGDLVNYSHPSDNPSACAACTRHGGRPSCPMDADDSTMVIGFAMYCQPDWLLALPPSFDMAGVFFGGLAGGHIADRHGRRRTYLVSLSLFALLYCLSPFAPSFAAYCVLKFGIG